jgi:hypothetical protein
MTAILMSRVLKLGVAIALVGLVAVAAGSLAAGQAPAAPAQGGARGTPPPPPPPPEPQAGHPSGKLVIWGDLVNFERPGVPNRCTAQSRYKRGARVGFRMTAVDGGSGEVENTAVVVAHVSYGGQTIDVPMRWRGVGNFPAAEYPRQPSEMWTGVWTVPMDAPIGELNYTVTATDRFGRTASFRPFPNHLSQLTIVDQ